MHRVPQAFPTGVMAVFSLLLPGAILTWLLMDRLGPVVLGARYAQLAGVQTWVAFVLASYLLGHVACLLGAWLGPLYGLARRHSHERQIALLAEHGRLWPWPVRALVWLLFGGDPDLACRHATRIKRQALGALGADDAVDGLDWAWTLLALECPASLAVVQRYMAEARLYRCFTGVLLVLLAVWPWQQRWPLVGALVVLLLLLLAIWRYMDRRFRAARHACVAVITLTARAGRVAVADSAPAAGGPTPVGAVVMRRRRGKAQYLLMETPGDPGHRERPKGRGEDGEHPAETAVRVVHEQTGVWAGVGQMRPRPRRWAPIALRAAERRHRRLAADLGTVLTTVDGTVVTVRHYLLEAVGTGMRVDPKRQHRWLALDDAVATLSRLECRELLRLAEQRAEQQRLAAHRP